MNGLSGIKRTLRLLKNHSNTGASQLPVLFFVQLTQINPLKNNISFSNMSFFTQKAHDTAHQSTFTTAALSHNHHNFFLSNLKIDIMQYFFFSVIHIKLFN